ncbi:MAG: phosphoribosylglycinamide formyltransferase [Bacteroidetes bacterium]|nr:phosphoribosylglycinamide formyltransferase [Bacteroidota bacterium]
MKEQTGSTKRIAIFASGKGSNAQKIIDHFRSSTSVSKSVDEFKTKVEIELIVSNKPDAGVVKIAQKEKIPFIIIDKEKFFRGDAYLPELKEKKIDFIILAGFLWKIPQALIHAYPNKIVNLHPALLPKYGGKGMYGQRVHEAVIAAGEKESGITIHYVDEIYDHGKIIFQAKCVVTENDTAESLAEKIHALEHTHFPRVIEELIGMQNIVKRS